MIGFKSEDNLALSIGKIKRKYVDRRDPDEKENDKIVKRCRIERSGWESLSAGDWDF